MFVVFSCFLSDVIYGEYKATVRVHGVEFFPSVGPQKGYMD